MNTGTSSFEARTEGSTTSTTRLPIKQSPRPIPPPASCPIGWQPAALTPVFFGVRDYTTAEGAPVNLRVFFPSLDGAVFSAPILEGCGHYPLILFAHGDCHPSTAHYKDWFTLPAQLARAGYVVVVPELPSISANPSLENHPALPAITNSLAWMRQQWEHQDVLMSEQATGIMGHSFGSMLAARVAKSNNLAAYVSLSAGWHEWGNGFNTLPIIGLDKPMLLIWGNQDPFAVLPQSIWPQLTIPRHRIIFEQGTHWDYLPASTTSCGTGPGACPALAAAAADYVTMFFAKYLPPELSPNLPDQIPDSLTPPPLNLTPEQEFYAGGYLNGVPGLGSSRACQVSQDWVTDPTRFIINDFGYVAGTWRVNKHVRLLGDLNGDGRLDIVGFGDKGVLASTNLGNGNFNAPGFVVADFGYNQGWRVDRHPRMLADLTGTGREDITGFGNDGVFICHGGITQPIRVIDNFGYNQGWRVDQHPRFMADLTGDKRADIVGLGNDGVWVSLNGGNYSFQPAQLAVTNFGYNQGWRVDRHPRFMADLTGDGSADIVGFGNDGVWVALSNGNGTFQQPHQIIANFGYNAGNWRVDQHPRMLADLTGNGRADIVGFGNAGVWVALNNGNGTFQSPQFVLADFGYNAGNWRVNQHPRFLADLTGDGRADIIGFGNDGVYAALNNGDGTFKPVRRVLDNFGYNAGNWRVELHPRFAADITGDKRADILGFGNQGVFIALNRGDGTFK